MENKIQFLECEGFQIGAFIEGHQLEEHSTYFPANVLFYVKQGQLNIRVNDELQIVSKNKFCLVRKLTQGSVFKSWSKSEKYAIVYAFILKDHFIKDAIREFKSETSVIPISKKIIHLPKNKILQGLFDSIVSYLSDSNEIDKMLVEIKTKEALLGILKFHPEYYSIFSQIAIHERANLEEFMEHNFQYNISLKVLAESSGRSLSTFNREFKSIFKETPHRWILKKRLNRAKQLLLSTKRKPSEFYMELGFEDLAHFSRTFKKEFGKTPTEIKKLSKLN